jgi:hypothetical protein
MCNVLQLPAAADSAAMLPLCNNRQARACDAFREARNRLIWFTFFWGARRLAEALTATWTRSGRFWPETGALQDSQAKITVA